MNEKMMQLLSQLKANRVQFLMQRRLNLPANLAGDPNEIINYLLKTGQVSQDDVNRAYQQMGQFRR